jgi:PAS domain S-box-containing protein
MGRRRAVAALAAACAGVLALGAIAGALAVSWAPRMLRPVGAPTALMMLVAIAGVAATAASRRRARLLAAAAVGASAVLALIVYMTTGYGHRQAILWNAGAFRIELLEIAPLTALSFLFVAGALATAGHDAAELLIAVPAAIALLVTTGHLFGSRELTSLGTTTAMSIWSAVAIMLLALAFLAASPDARWMRILTADSPAGFMARRLALVALVAPVALAWLRLLGQRRGLYGTELGISIYTVSVVAALLAVVFVTTSKLEAADDVRRRQERELQDAETKFRTLVERSPDGILVVDRSSRIRLANSVAEGLFGYTREELVGSDVAVLVPQEFRDRHGAQMDGYRSAPGIRPMGTGLSPSGLRKDGTRFAAEIALAPIPSSEGQLVLASVRDVTARQAMEDALRRSEAILRQTQRVTKVGGWQFDVASGKVEWTEEVYRVHGVPDDYDPGDPERDMAFYAPEDRPRIAEAFARAIEKGEPYDLVLRLLTGDGRPIWVRTVGEAELRGGEVVRVYGNIMDVTERVEAADVLARRTADLERSNRELEQFAYVASHDLQEPLRMVASYTQLLGRRYRDHLDQDAKEFIDFAVDGAVRMQNLIQDLLLYSRVGSNGRPFEKIDSHAALARAVANLRVAIAESGAVVTNGVLPAVVADEMQLTQVFQNLVGNGIKFRRQGVTPRIHVSAERRGAEWIFSVRDNGIGIAPEFRTRIFAIFQRLHTRDEYPGTGIGLAICKRIVDRHRGRIWAESGDDGGTTFKFSLATAGSGEPQ